MAHNRLPFERIREYIYVFTDSVRKIEDGEEIVESLYSFEESRIETSRGALEHVTRRDIVPSSVFFCPIYHSTCSSLDCTHLTIRRNQKILESRSQKCGITVRESPSFKFTRNIAGRNFQLYFEINFENKTVMIIVVESNVESCWEILFGKLQESRCSFERKKFLNLSILKSEDQEFTATAHYFFSLVS